MQYFESRLQANPENLDELKRKFNICESLGIKNIIIEIDSKNKFNSDSIKSLNPNKKFNLYLRINIKSDNIKIYKKELNKCKKMPFLLSVESQDKEIQLTAARDSRIDIISYSNPKILKTLNSGVISMTKQNKTFIEFSLAPIMEENKYIQSKQFRNLYRSLQLAINQKANYIISGNFKKPFDIRHPRTIISIFNTLFDIPLLEAKKAISKNIENLLNRKRERINGDIIENGIKLIK